MSDSAATARTIHGTCAAGENDVALAPGTPPNVEVASAAGPGPVQLPEALEGPLVVETRG